MRDDTIPSFRNSFFALSLTLEIVLLERLCSDASTAYQ